MVMNIYHLCGDISHVLSIVVLLHRIHVVQDARGISLRSIELFLLVYLLQCTDLLVASFNPYKLLLAVFSIASSASVICKIHHQMSVYSTHSHKNHDAFCQWKFDILPCAFATFMGYGLASFIGLLEILRTFSVHLEYLAILPQIGMSLRHHDIDCGTPIYIGLMGLCRAFYIANMVYATYRDQSLANIYATLQLWLYVAYFCHCVIVSYSVRHHGNDDATEVEHNDDRLNEYQLLPTEDKNPIVCDSLSTADLPVVV